MAPSLVRFLRENGHVKPNYRQVEIPCPLGLLIAAAALAALVPLALLNGLWDSRTLDVEGVFLVLGVTLLGLADDAYAVPATPSAPIPIAATAMPVPTRDRRGPAAFGAAFGTGTEPRSSGGFQPGRPCSSMVVLSTAGERADAAVTSHCPSRTCANAENKVTGSWESGPPGCGRHLPWAPWSWPRRSTTHARTPTRSS